MFHDETFRIATKVERSHFKDSGTGYHDRSGKRQWDLENGLTEKCKDHFAGRYDHMHDNDSRWKEAYVPGTQEMPETWDQDLCKKDEIDDPAVE